MVNTLEATSADKEFKVLSFLKTLDLNVSMSFQNWRRTLRFFENPADAFCRYKEVGTCSISISIKRDSELMTSHQP